MHREDNAAQLRYFILEPAYRGIGLGKKMMQLYMDHLQKAGFQQSYLWTTHELEAAASLYKRYGFRLSEEKPSGAFGKPLYEQKYELNPVSPISS
jgi:peptidyl-dipeptidase Dcp